MPDGRRADVTARALLTLGALAPYWRLLTLRVLYVTDDYFASDIFNGELPGRVLIGNLLRHGHLPVWTSRLCSGLPLAGAPADPIGLLLFTFLPPAPALDLFVIVLLLVAAHGAYALARRFGADRIAAVLAGLAFAGSGYIACQLKHLGIVSTVVWLPIGLNVLDRALGVPRHAPDAAGDGAPAPAPARRALLMALFAAIFAEQVLCAFPQSAYICGLVYGAFAVFRVASNPHPVANWRVSLSLLAGIAAAAVVGAAVGAFVLLPLSAAGNISDRIEALGWAWSTRLAYWPRNALTFLFPYANGDISNNSYSGPPFFWEDYGYVGIVTFLLAIYGAVRERRRPVALFTISMTLLAYFCVLGRATPVFRVIYLVVPGIAMFRFPTRFLIVVELGLALLGALGLTRLRRDLGRRWNPPSRVPQIVALALCGLTALDLFVHQPRQNPMVPASSWLEAPATVDIVHSETAAPRTFTPRHRDFHRLAFLGAQGWTNVEPYYRMRDVLEPNTGAAFWDTPSADCYAAIAPRWYVDLWGDHNRELSVMTLLTNIDTKTRTLRLSPVVPNVLRAFGVTHLLSPYPATGAKLPLVAHSGDAYVYRIDDGRRVRFVPRARYVASDREAVQHLVDPAFDPNREVMLLDVPFAQRSATSGSVADEAVQGASASIVNEDPSDIVIEADAPRDGFLLLADTYYPGWAAEVDGRSVPIYRANLAVRAIPLRKGRHQIRFAYELPGLAAGLRISLLSASALLLWVAGAVYAGRRSAR